MAVMITKFCCCAGIKMRLGSIVVGILSLIGSSIMLAMTIPALVWTDDTKSDPSAANQLSNTTIKHMEDTIDLEYWSLTMDLISMFVAVLLIYGAIKRIRPLLYTYIVWTIIIIVTSFGALVYFALDAARVVVAVYLVQFIGLLGTAIYFMLVVYSYSELIRDGTEFQSATLEEQARDGQRQFDIKVQYSRFGNPSDNPGMGDDREKLTI